MSISNLLVYTFLSALAINSCTCAPRSNAGRIAGENTAGGSGEGEAVVNFSVWSGYVPDQVFAEFTAKTGIRVNVSNYSSNEELLAKIQAGARGIDVAVPSDYMVSIMRHLDLLLPIDRARITNFADVDPRFLGKPFDPDNAFSLPMSWTFTGIAVNRNLTSLKISGWRDLLSDDALKHKVSLLDDARETVGAVLKMQGRSLNSVEVTELSEAKQQLNKVRERISAFTSEPIDALMQGEFAVSHIYSSDAFQARQKTGGKVEVIIPSEGGTLSIDNVIILKTAEHVGPAYALINHLLTKEVGAVRAQTSFAGPVAKGVQELLPEELRKDELLFPPAAVLARLEMMHDLGDGTGKYDRIWTELKAGAE